MTFSSLPTLSVEGRIDRVRDALVARNIDGLVVTNPSNIRWCTGFTGSFGSLLIGPESAVLVTDSRYREQAPVQLTNAEAMVDVETSMGATRAGAALFADSDSVALEADHVNWDEQQRWVDALDAELLPTTALITEMRSVKNEAELARMTMAASIVDEVLASVAAMFVVGTTERDLALALDDGMRARGAAGPAYETIVASGPNAALPHARPGDRAFTAGDLVVVDAGALVDGYRSDMTRTFAIGAAPDKAAEIHEVVTRAQAAGVAAVGPGVETGHIDRVCRDLITEAGFGEDFGHGTGHGVGIDIHELPSVRAGNTAILQPGHVITVEPGIYLAGYGGVRVEDMVVVTLEGCRPLTKHPKISLSD